MSLQLPSDSDLKIQTARLTLEPVTDAHAEEFYTLFDDPELHRFVPFEQITREEHKNRCQRWSLRRSPDGSEFWLNWAARHKETNEVMAHFQAGVTQGAKASVGYMIARKYHRQGLASEGLGAVIQLLQSSFKVCEIQVAIDSRNEASLALVRKLGFVQTDLIKNADHFKGERSDEIILTRRL